MIQIDINKKLYGVNGHMDLDINLSIKNKTFLALSGSSGAGKTTFLRIIAGLEKSNGIIKVDDEIWQDEKIFLPPQKRKIGFVFQDYALFPNMNVLQNLLYIKNDLKKANKLLQMSGLEELKKRFPNTLSGGQKQRVGLCRAMMNDPKILLLDEPLSALDFDLKQSLQDEILNLHEEFKTITILVSHDISEIYKLSHEVIILENGKIINQGSPKKVFLKTKGSQKFSFLGQILDIIKVDVIHVAIVAIGQQIVEVVISQDEAKKFKKGQKVSISTKAFAPIISKI